LEPYKWYKKIIRSKTKFSLDSEQTPTPAKYSTVKTNKSNTQDNLTQGCGNCGNCNLCGNLQRKVTQVTTEAKSESNIHFVDILSDRSDEDRQDNPTVDQSIRESRDNFSNFHSDDQMDIKLDKLDDLPFPNLHMDAHFPSESTKKSSEGFGSQHTETQEEGFVERRLSSKAYDEVKKMKQENTQQLKS